MLGAAATPSDFLTGAESGVAADRGSAGATSILWMPTGWDDPATLDVLVETLMAHAAARVREMASAASALIAWCAVSDARPATDVQMKAAVRVLRGNHAMARHVTLALCWMLRTRHDEALIDAASAAKVVPSLIAMVRRPGDRVFRQPVALELLADAGPAAKDAISLSLRLMT